jgi:hypothetical protein
MIPDLNFINGSEYGSVRKGSDWTTGSIRKFSDNVETDPITNQLISELVESNFSVSKVSSDLQGSEKKFKKEIQQFRKKKNPIKITLVSYEEIKTDLGIGNGVQARRMDFDEIDDQGNEQEKPTDQGTIQRTMAMDKHFEQELPTFAEARKMEGHVPFKKKLNTFAEARKMDVVKPDEFNQPKPTKSDIKDVKDNVKKSINKFLRGMKVNKVSRKRLIRNESNNLKHRYLHAINNIVPIIHLESIMTLTAVQDASRLQTCGSGYKQKYSLYTILPSRPECHA